ncbi:glycosyltransferase family 25 protein [[Acidovorax] ebreus]|uniref:Glycosyl transferase family 25 n=1 Tax=Acidovorax ebreus (strain TPSY) TaxID=535289 RepID=A0A9J9U9C4_ACIET|nr:glycosyltransferase family 25 protein [[Acidovorax] ebreus]ACM31690.1 glycosyl transferase family 25 [[Acidovorax] ebreus TPSY]
MSNIPIVYINLAKDTERQQRMQAQFSRLGLETFRLPAVRWSELSAEAQAHHFSAELNSHQYFKPMGSGEKGCYCSHITAWRQLLDSAAAAMAVFEDDVRLLPAMPEALRAISTLPADCWDMVKLFGREREKIASRRPLVGSLELITYRRVPSFAAGYVISRSGARKMLESRQPFGRPVDVDMRFWFENGMRVFGVHPSVVALDDTSKVSSIWPDREPRALIMQRLRKLKMKMELIWGNARHESDAPHVSETL